MLFMSQVLTYSLRKRATVKKEEVHAPITQEAEVEVTRKETCDTNE